MPPAHLRFEIRLNAPVEAVWEALWGSGSWPRIFADLLEVKAKPQGPAVEGQTFHYVRRIEGKRVHFLYKLGEVQYLTGWRGIESSEGLFENLEDIGALMATGSGTKIIVDYYLEIGPNTRLTPQELRRGLDSFWRNAKKLIERESI